MDKPIHGKLYNMINLKELSLSNIHKKEIDNRLLNLTNLTSLTLKNVNVCLYVKESFGLFKELKYLEVELIGMGKISKSLCTLSKLETLIIHNHLPIKVPLEINHLTQLKNLTILNENCNIGGLFNLDKYSEFSDHFIANKCDIYKDSLLIYNYTKNIIMPENILYVNILGKTDFINNLPSHIEYLRINDCANVTNLPFALKELHVRNVCKEFNNVKIPFGCKVFMQNILLEI